MHTLFGVFLLLDICGCNDAGRYVVPPDNLLLDICMYGELNLVILLWSGYHINFSVLFPLLIFLHIFI